MKETQEMWVSSLGQEYPLEKSIATHTIIVVWKIPWTDEPGRLQSIESQRAGHNWSDLACAHSIIKAMVFPVVIWMWALDHKEGWEPKNWCFWIVALEKTLESPLDCKEIKPVNLKGNKPWIFTEGLILKLKRQHFDHLMWRESSFARPWCWKGLRAGGEGSNGGWDGWMASLTQWTWVWANSRRWWRTENPGVLQSMGLQRVGHDCTAEQQQMGFKM